ncbi:Addiction module antidote protein, HigA [Candidatus Magnetomorum sp. HK-1]|nr:Addiction module antidote protein, HigA [Candidatus Magnetomorum sp. HK-1]
MKKQSMHPGQVLKKTFIEPEKISIKVLSKQLDISTQKLSKIIKGQQSITYDLSLKLADIFPTPPEFWVLLQHQYDEGEKSRGTDSPFYQLMTIMGDAMLKLIGVQSNNEYQPRAIVLKEKRLYPDIVAFPKNKDREIVMIEFQGYKEPMMRYIMASKISMMCTQEQYTGPILGAIVYTDTEYMKSSLPYSIQSQCGKSWIKGEFIEIDLSQFTEKDLTDIDEQLIVLAPFTLPKNYPKNSYIQKCRQWKKQIDRMYTDETVHQVTDLLSLLILDRQRNMNRKDIQAMFDFDISQTKVGQELFEEGKIEGEKKGKIEGKIEGEKKAAKKLIAKLMSKKFDIQLRRIMPRLEPLRTVDMMDLGENLLTMNSFEDAYQWINNRKQMIKMAA